MNTYMERRKRVVPGGKQRTINLIIILTIIAAALQPAAAQGSAAVKVYLPMVQNKVLCGELQPCIHLPFFDAPAPYYNEMAVFWFGRVNQTENSIDVRAGYTRQALHINLAVIDRLLHFDGSPKPTTLRNWDAASLYLVVPGSNGQAARTLRYDAQLNWMGEGDTRIPYQAAFEWKNGTWQSVQIPFTTYTSWQGNSPGDIYEDRGWLVNYTIPFSSLSYNSQPAAGSLWQMALAVYDRDDAAGTAIPVKKWPPSFDPAALKNWGVISFGLPVYTPPPSSPGATVTIREENGTVVPDGDVGGHSTCGDGLDFWSEWGDFVYTDPQVIHQISIQNQANLGDWPCFSRYYITFPLGAVPPGKVIRSATFSMYHFGNSDPSHAPASYIQVLRVGSDWQENSLSWNSAPIPVENYSGQWVDPLMQDPVWPGVLKQWDVSRLVADAYAAGQPARMVLYSGDWDMHSGKYFHASETGQSSSGDDPRARPVLKIEWGNR